MTKEELDKQELTYDFLKLNFVEDKNTPHFNLYPQCMLSTDGYYIGAQLIGGCDCGKHLEVYNRKNKIGIRFEDSNKSQFEQFKRKFTIGDLKTMLNLVGLNDLADNLMTEEEIKSLKD